MFSIFRKKTEMPSRQQALPGRAVRMKAPEKHAVLGTPMSPPFPAAMKTAMFGMGCFWGAERMFWTVKGVHTTAVGYAAGYTPNPTYEEVCSGMTDLLTKRRFKPPVRRETVRLDWERRGYSCQDFVDPPGRE